MRLHALVNSWGPQDPARGPPPRHRGRPSLRGHTLHLPQTWERRPCSATCSPGARRETLPYTSEETGSLWKRRMRPRPAREPERPGLARSPRGRRGRGSGTSPAAAGGRRAGGPGPGRARLLPGRRSPLRLPSLPRRGSRAPRSALAFPAECHHYHSKGKGPAEGVAGGPTAPQDGRSARARAAGGHSAAAQAPAGPGRGHGHSGGPARLETCRRPPGGSASGGGPG